MVLLIVAREVLACIGHPDRIPINIRGGEVESPRQGAGEARCFAAGDADQVLSTDHIPIGILQGNAKPVILNVVPGTLVLLILGDVHAAPTGLDGLAFLPLAVL